MKFRVTYQRAGTSTDVEIVVDGSVSAGDLAGALVRGDPLRPFDPLAPTTMAILDGQRVLPIPAEQAVVEGPIVSGATVTVVGRPDGTAATGATPAVLRVLEGPNAGQEFRLGPGTSTVGRSEQCDVILNDPLVSKLHARIMVGDFVEIVDTNSSNGVEIDGLSVGRATLRSGDRVLLGNSLVSVESISASMAGLTAPPGGAIAFVRSPRVEVRFGRTQISLPDPPRAHDSQRFPLVALVTPVALGAVLYLVTRSLTSLLFVALSPLMMVGQWVESRWSGRRSHATQVAEFRAALTELHERIVERQATESISRDSENPSVTTLTQAVASRNDLLWCRRPDRPGYLEVRFGTATQQSRVQVDQEHRQHAGALESDVTAFIADHKELKDAPVVASFRDAGAMGVAGRGEPGAALARSLVLQLAILHSPDDLTLAACFGSGSAARWDWLKWLPHTMGTHSPVDVDLLASGPGSGTALVNALVALVDERLGSGHGEPTTTPNVVLIVEDDTAVDRSHLVALAERGDEAGVHVLWCADDQGRLPAVCRQFAAENGTEWEAGFVDDGLTLAPVAPDVADLASAASTARAMAPLTDAGARVDDSSDLPRAVSYLSLAGLALADGSSDIVDRWVEADSVTSRRAAGKRRTAGSLRALIGQSSSGPVILDLRAQGPHALVGGTTGSGKSELLQTWVMSLAASHSPERVTFLFIDYKGGAAFGECVDLPHAVGLVTDLNPHLVRRALISLDAELRHREHLLNAAMAKDLIEMEAQGHDETPPSLIIVVDEFAALATEIPEFVDGVVNVAQRGRSLGLHLILATQRPAGVIKDNLRANTNLRLALRMADEEDSSDVLGVPDAAAFDPSAPGRAAVKSGHGRLVPFQAAYVGGHTSAEPEAPDIGLRVIGFSTGADWAVAPESSRPSRLTSGPTDLQRLVRSAQQAAIELGLKEPRKPWLPELKSVLELADLATERRDDHLVFAQQDSPEEQFQPVASFDPDRDGNLVVYGTGGSGKSTLLRSLAVAAGYTVRGGPVQVYGLDFGARGLHMIEELPHVGSIVPGDDAERVVRLLRMVRQMIDERSNLFAAKQSNDIADYRVRADQPHLPRILLLLDGLASFRQTYDIGGVDGVFDLLTSIASDGRAVGVHLVLTADRVATVPSALASLIPRRVVLRTADDGDLALLGVPKDMFDLASPPGRGFLDGHEIQVAVLGGDPSTVGQAHAIGRLAAAIRRNSTWPDAQPVRRLPERVLLMELPGLIGDEPTLGLEDASLAPISFPRSGTFVVAGPPLSGRSTTVATMLAGLKRLDGSIGLAYFGSARSPLIRSWPWDVRATSPEDCASMAEMLTAQIGDSHKCWVVVVENPGDLVNTEADLPLQDLVTRVRAAESLVIAEGDTSTLTGSWPLLQALRFSRRGIVLQPDQTDGDMLFRTPFPRVRRADFPPGRGLLTREGRVFKVQVADPGGEGTAPHSATADYPIASPP